MWLTFGRLAVGFDDCLGWALPRLHVCRHVCQHAFIALDAENLGELVNHSYHTDFGDNVLPYYKANTNTQIDTQNYTSDSSDDDSDRNSNIDQQGRLSDEQISRIEKHIPPSILRYLNRSNRL